MSEANDPIVGYIRVWLEEPNLLLSYERRGIPAGTLRLRRELAVALLAKYEAAWPVMKVTADPARIEVISEIMTMAREVLAGSDGQVMPLTGDGSSPLDALLGAPS
jgi:hypothetical protein